MPPDLQNISFQTARAREIAALIGMENTLKLIDHYGGQGCYVPKKPAGATLWKVVGEKAARTLAKEYGGAELDIPLEWDAHVQWMRAHGDSIETIIRRVRRHRATVRNCLNSS